MIFKERGGLIRIRALHTGNIGVVNLAGSRPKVGELTHPIGWGKTSDSSNSAAAILHEVSNRPVISNEDCNDVYTGIIYDGILCIDTQGGEGVCNVSYLYFTAQM